MIQRDLDLLELTWLFSVVIGLTPRLADHAPLLFIIVHCICMSVCPLAGSNTSDSILAVLDIDDGDSSGYTGYHPYVCGLGGSYAGGASRGSRCGSYDHSVLDLSSMMSARKNHTGSSTNDSTQLWTPSYTNIDDLDSLGQDYSQIGRFELGGCYEIESSKSGSRCVGYPNSPLKEVNNFSAR